MDSEVSAFSIYQKQVKKRKPEPPKSQVSAKKVKNEKTKKVQSTREVIKENGKIKKKKHLKQDINGVQLKLNEKGNCNGAVIQTEIDDQACPSLVPVDFEVPLEKETVNKPDNLEKQDSKTVKSSRKASPKKKNNKKHSKNQKEKAHSVSFNPATYGLGIFKWLLHPKSPKEFFEKYWEKEVLYVERKDQDFYTEILTTDRLDNILREFPLHYTRNVDVVTYENGVKEVHNQEGRAIPSVVWDFYSNGCSIRILNPQTYDKYVHSIISSLQEYFGTMVGANVYLTPPGSQGFAPHFDDIEAFIIQLEGRKHWKLYKPQGKDVLARESSQNFKSEDLDKPFMEVTLNAGDLLYFPRGTIHEGRTDENAHSLHITVSVYQHTSYIDLLEHVVPAALKRAAEEDVEFRKGLPLNYLKHVGYVNKDKSSKRRSNILSVAKDLLEKLIDYIDVDVAADQLGRKFMHDSMPPLYTLEEASHSSRYDGDYMKNGQIFNRVEIGIETKVRLLRYHSIRLLVDQNESAKLYYNADNAKSYHGEEEQWLEVDKCLLPVIETLQNKYPEFVAVEDLPDNDEVAKLQLVADLWERGLLITSEPLEGVSSDEENEESDTGDGDDD